MINVRGRIHALEFELKNTAILRYDDKLTGGFRPCLVLTPDEYAELLNEIDISQFGQYALDGAIKYRGFYIFVRP